MAAAVSGVAAGEAAAEQEWQGSGRLRDDGGAGATDGAARAEGANQLAALARAGPAATVGTPAASAAVAAAGVLVAEGGACPSAAYPRAGLRNGTRDPTRAGRTERGPRPPCLVRNAGLVRLDYQCSYSWIRLATMRIIQSNQFALASRRRILGSGL